MNPLWVLRTARLVLTPVGGSDLPDLRAMKGDPRVFAIMLGGVRSPQQTAEELAEEVASWGAEGFGTWAVRDAKTGQFLGITGLERRHDGRGIALRFAVWPEVQGHGLAREAAAAALQFGHQQAGLERIVAVARENNFGSRIVLGGIGMTECDSFAQHGYRMVLYKVLIRVHTENTGEPRKPTEDDYWREALSCSLCCSAVPRCPPCGHLTRLGDLLPHRVDQRIYAVVVVAQIRSIILALRQPQRGPLGHHIDDLGFA